MPRLRAFRGTRYDQAKSDLEEVIAPPYDVIDAKERAVLAKRSPFNSVHVELPQGDDGGGLSAYEGATRLLLTWIDGGVLVRDEAPALYVYKMTFLDDENVTQTTIGVIGALGIEAEGGTSVRPHEETTPKPMGDRLELFRATRTNLSPIWGLSLGSGLTSACEETTKAVPSARVLDDSGVTHEIWPVTDALSVARIQAIVESDSILLADGHHRYQTARTYRDELHQRADPESSDSAIMALIVELSESSLFVGPIHRVLSGLQRPSQLFDLLAGSFEVTPSSRGTRILVREMNEREGLAVITAESGAVLSPKHRSDEPGPGNHGQLDSRRLDIFLDSLPPHEISYDPDPSKGSDAIETGSADAVFLLRPVPISVISATAREGRLMPPKTTYFHPKPATGMVFRQLD